MASPASQELDLGSFESFSDDVSERRQMLPIPNAIDRANAKVRLEMEPDAARITSTTTVGQHLVTNLFVDWHVSGDCPAMVFVTYGGKTIVAKTVIRVKHAKPKPFGLSCVFGSQAPAEFRTWAGCGRRRRALRVLSRRSASSV